jgi:hypothetical protein
VVPATSTAGSAASLCTIEGPAAMAATAEPAAMADALVVQDPASFATRMSSRGCTPRRTCS